MKKSKIIIILIVMFMVTLSLVGIKEKKLNTENEKNTINTNSMAIKIENKDTGEYEESDIVPTSGYTLNTEDSYCEINGEIDENITLEYRDGKVYAKVTDTITNCYVFFNVITDATGPTLTVTTPASTSSTSPTTTSSSSYTVKGTVTDDESGVASLTVNGTAVTVGDDGSWSTKVSLTLNSTKTITVIATDSAGNSTTITRYVKRVDTSGPTITITDAFDDRSGSNTMAGTVTDLSGIKSVIVSVEYSNGWNGYGTKYTATVSGNNWSVDFDLTSIGSYYIHVSIIATDTLGNESTTVIYYDECSGYCSWS